MKVLIIAGVWIVILILLMNYNKKRKRSEQVTTIEIMFERLNKSGRN
jgi:hypothetical protein